MITYDDFKKVELKIAKIITAEEVPGAEKLLKLQIDLGQEKRQIVAGIKKNYQPGSLIGKEIVVVINLEPRMVMGVESNGMLLAASDEGGPVSSVMRGQHGYRKFAVFSRFQEIMRNAPILNPSLDIITGDTHLFKGLTAYIWYNAKIFPAQDHACIIL